MPSLGADMDEGTLLEWLVGPGDLVHRGDPVAVVETAKSTIEVECFETGTMAELLVEPGTTVPVGTPLALIGATVKKPEHPEGEGKPHRTRKPRKVRGPEGPTETEKAEKAEKRRAARRAPKKGALALYTSSDVVLTRHWESHARANRRCSREREAPRGPSRRRVEVRVGWAARRSARPAGLRRLGGAGPGGQAALGILGVDCAAPDCRVVQTKPAHPTASARCHTRCRRRGIPPGPDMPRICEGVGCCCQV
ncbi:hypothetical protein OG522_04885 [Streptomyces sp. NBC_01431]